MIKSRSSLISFSTPLLFGRATTGGALLVLARICSNASFEKELTKAGSGGGGGGGGYGMLISGTG